MIKVTDEQIIWASNNSKSAAEASRLLGINYKTYKNHAIRLGVFTTNQSGKGESKNRSRKYNIDDSIFNKITNVEQAYWLGFIAADGSIVGNSLKFMLKADDANHLRKFLDFAKSDYPIGYCNSHYKSKDCTVHYFKACYIKVNSRKIVENLNNYGITQNKKYKNINFLNSIPDKFKMSFLCGLFDGDGSVGVYNGKPVITISINKATSYSIQNLLNTVGINYNVQNRDNIDVIYIQSMHSINTFYNFYRTSINLDRKRDSIARIIEDYHK